MNLFIDILILGLLGVIAFQDFKYRAVSWVVFPVLLMLVVVGAFQQNSVGYIVEQLLFNFLFVVSQLLMLTIYFSIKNHKATNIFNTYLGLGDVLFFVVLAASFSFLNFVFVYIFSLLSVAVVYLFYRLLKKNATSQIPLAGGMAVSLVFLMLLKNSTEGLNFYDDAYLMEKLVRYEPFNFSNSV